MKKYSPRCRCVLLGTMLFTALACRLTVSGMETADTKAPYDGSWGSLQKMPVPAWFDDGKIGIFIHWGPYSAIGYRKGGQGLR